MPKQIKIGFDRVPSPRGKFRENLYDVLSGEQLFSAEDLPLETEVEKTIPRFRAARNSTPIIVVNKSSRSEGKSLKIEEQFPEFSEVSSTLLGVSRAEEQLSLFSDVSTLGFDDDTWVFEDRNSIDIIPAIPWYTRRNKIYGRRGLAELKEFTDEQALALSAFPVQFSFPFGPKYAVFRDWYDEVLFNQYKNFIAAGKILYKLYTETALSETGTSYEAFAREYFVPDFIRLVDRDEVDIDGYNITSKGVFLGLGNAYDVVYDFEGDMDPQESFDQIEKWTIAFYRLLNNELAFPDPEFSSLPVVQNIISGIKSAQFDMRPGYTGEQRSYGKLTSRRTYRYQPGRISGFTFGIRANADPASAETNIEWGISNETDEYCFQINGGNFNIIRRSTIAMPDELLERQGLDPSIQTVLKGMPGYANENVNVYETIIPRDLFNYDSLTGNGPSGYNVAFDNVTMWKIEFGWYGAIGAKFYAYIPVGNDACRWVLVHWLIIENSISEPCLRDPNFRFKYLIDIQNSSRITEPVFIYKYGSSYYIDGGDEGTSSFTSASTDTAKSFSENTPIIGLLPKNYITNRDNLGVTNNKKSFLNEVVISSTEPALIKVKKLKGSSEGFHFSHMPQLKAGVSRTTLNKKVQISERRDAITIIDGTEFKRKGLKVIANGLYNVYVGNIKDQKNSAFIERSLDYTVEQRAISDRVIIHNSDRSFDDPANKVFDAFIQDWAVIAASDVPITSNVFKIHFLQKNNEDLRTGRDQRRLHNTDFAFTITNEKPAMVDISALPAGDNPVEGVDYPEGATQVLRFGDNLKKFDESMGAHLSHIPKFERLDPFIQAEDFEFAHFKGEIFEYDWQLDFVEKEKDDGGKISGLVGRVAINDFYIIGSVELEENRWRLIFQDRPSAPNVTAEQVSEGNIEIGSNGIPSGIIIVREPYDSVNNPEDPVWAIDVDTTNQTSNIFNTILAEKTFQTRSVILYDNFDVNERNQAGEAVQNYPNVFNEFMGPFNIFPLYLTVSLRDFAIVSGIAVQQFNSEGSTAHTPNWLSSSVTYDIDENLIIDTDAPINPIQFPYGTSLNEEPSTFTSIQNDSALNYDSQLTQPLRDGETIYSAYVSADETVALDLKHVFGPDRYAIVPDKYNNEAIYITAETIKTYGADDNIVQTPSGLIEMNVTIREQN
jgi:hypothetical protein